MPARPLEQGWLVRPAVVEDLPALLPLVRAYADFYESSPTDEGLETMCRVLIAGPVDEGVLLSGCDASGAVVGFAAMAWKWSSLRGAKVGNLEDLFVDPEARGSGLADALIQACAEQAREYGAPALLWLTMADNARAQAVYNRSGAKGEPLIEYDLELGEVRLAGPTRPTARIAPVADLGAPIAYAALEAGTPVYSSDGMELGKVEHVLADADEDVFDGIVIDRSVLPGGHRFVDASQVAQIHERGVVVAVEGAAAESLPEPSENPAVMKANADTVGRRESETAFNLERKLRRAWDVISGKW